MSKNSFVEQHYGIARVEIVEVGEEDSDEYDEEDLGIAMRRDEHINMESIQRIINGVVPPRQEDEAEEEEDEVERKEMESEEEQFMDCLDSETPQANLSSEENKKCHVISDKGNETFKEIKESGDHVDKAHPAEQLSTEEDQDEEIAADDNINVEGNLIIFSSSSSNDENESSSSCYGDGEESASSIEEADDTAGEDLIGKKDSSVEADKKDSTVQADQENSSTEPSTNAEEPSTLKEKDETIEWQKVDDRLASQPKQTSDHSSSVEEVQSVDKDIDFDTEDMSMKRTLQTVAVDRMDSDKHKIKVGKNKKTLETLPKKNSASSATDDDDSKSEEETDPTRRIHFKNFLKKCYNSDLSHPRYRKPLELGWVRELVYRNMNSGKRTRFADVYYYTPKGRKLRSSVQVKQFLTAGLTLKNFTFAKESLGINDNVREIVRSARISLRSKLTDMNKRALGSTRRMKELKRYMKTTIFSLKKKPPSSFRSLLPSKAKKSKLSDEFEWGSENETNNSNDGYSDDDIHIIKSYTCTQKCPKALHFIPTIKCIECEMKFHPQCEEIPDDGSDIEDLPPIVDYVCRKCTLFNHRSTGLPPRHFLTPITSPPPIIFSPPAVFQLICPLSEKTLTPTSATQLAALNQDINIQELHHADEKVNNNASTETDDVEMQVLSSASELSSASDSLDSGSESDEDPIEDGETDGMQNVAAIYDENDPLFSEKNEAEDVVSFTEQDGGVLSLAGKESNLNVQHLEAEQQYFILQINPEIGGGESNFGIIKEGESNHAIEQQDDPIMEELTVPQVEPQSVSLASPKECEGLIINDEGGHATNLQLIGKDEQTSATVANIVDENSITWVKETQQEESSTSNEVQTLEGNAGSDNNKEQTQFSENKKVDEVIRKKARNMKPPCNCLPSKTTDVYNCNIFSEEERAVIYHKFWKNLSWIRKKKFVDGLVEKPVRTGDKRNGEDSCIFFLEKNGQRFRVCRKMFLNTLGIGEWSLNNWLKNIHDGYKPKKYWNDLILR